MIVLRLILPCPKVRRFYTVLPLLLAIQVAHSMQDLNDDDMAGVTGQDGVAFEWQGRPANAAATAAGVKPAGSNASLSLDEFRMTFDGSYVRGADIQWWSVNNTGTRLSTPTNFQTTFDIGAGAAGPALSISGAWTRNRIRIDRWAHSADLSKSPGALVFDSSGSFSVSNVNGLFDNAGNNAKFSLSIPDASLFFRQGDAGSPELLFDNIKFTPSFQGGRIAVGSNGLVVAAPTFNFDLRFDLKYEAAPSALDDGFKVTRGVATPGKIPILTYGWYGILNDFEWHLKGGGAWTNYNPANASEGIEVAMKWKYDPGFTWVIGDANPTGLSTATNPYGVLLEFDKWITLPGAEGGYGFNIRKFVLDTLGAGQGPGGLCWGADVTPTAAAGGTCSAGKFVNIAPGNGATAILIRDADLLAFSSRVRVSGPDPLDNLARNWGLVYTFGNVDGNIYIYPGNKAGTGPGLVADVLMMSQTKPRINPLVKESEAEARDRWRTGSHFMIADTCFQGVNCATSPQMYGIGIINSSVLLAANDVDIRLLPAGLSFSSNQARLQLKGTFGGGSINDGLSAALLRAADWDINAESSNLVFTLSPPAVGQAYLGYSSLTDLVGAPGALAKFSTGGTDGESAANEGSFFSMAEPGNPAAKLTLGGLSGRVELQDGRLDLIPSNEAGEGIGIPQLRFSHRLLMGAASTTGSTGAAFKVDSLAFDGKSIGRFVVPSATMFSSLTIKPQ